VQERALEQAEIDSIGTWLGGEEENYTIVETDHLRGGVCRSSHNQQQSKSTIFIMHVYVTHVL
jgi:hypothetical protein